MSWGVPVPTDLARGETGKVLYVWFDAPIGYVSFTKEWARLSGKPDDWKRWWQDPDARLVHFIGKDNIPFHTVVFPAMLLGMGQPWILPYDVPANEFYNLQGGKFSTSKNWTVPIDDFVGKFDAQAARFHLVASMPENSDSEWRFEDFQTTNNSLLADVVGNLAQRVLRFLEKNFDGRVPEVPAELVAELDRAILEECGAIGDPLEEIAQTRFRRAAEVFVQNGRVANVYIDRLAPWSLKKTDPVRCGAVLATACEWLVWMAKWMAPFMPLKAQALWEQLGLEGRADAPMPQALPQRGQWRSLRAGAKLGTPSGLFPKIEDAAIAAEVAALNARSQS
jgi:methionyl-tRNA synthetase